MLNIEVLYGWLYKYNILQPLNYNQHLPKMNANQSSSKDLIYTKKRNIKFTLMPKKRKNLNFEPILYIHIHTYKYNICTL